MYRIRTALFFLLCAFTVNAQNTKHNITNAVVTYDVVPIDGDLKSKLPSDYVIYAKNDMSRTEMKTVEGKKIVISDNLAQYAYTLTEKDGKKQAVRSGTESTKKVKPDPNAPSIELTREPKVIAGYTCYKAIVTKQTPNGPIVSEAWFNTELRCRNGIYGSIPGLNGFLMEYTTRDGDNNNYKLIAKSVDIGTTLNDSIFHVPAGFKIIMK